MRHGDKIKNLSRTKAHRHALLSNLACQLIEHKRIVTTLAKAKALRVYVEPLITKGKSNTTHQRRIVFSYLQDKEAISELFGAVAEKIAGRPGGYTRIIKLGIRTGDNADMAMIELVDFNEVYNTAVGGEAKEGAKKTRRSRGGKKSGTPEKAIPAVESKEEVTADDLKKVEGIGPKVAEALQAAGINSFAELASKSAEEIKAILDAADGNFAAQDPTTWPEQASMAAAGEWDKLKDWQDKLKGGKIAE
jgi:large subunit ribosomal protein L17